MENKIYRDEIQGNPYYEGRVCYQYSGNENYFRRIFSDAAKSERRPIEEPFFYGGFTDADGKIYVANPCSGFERVRSRINFRLKNNTWIKKITA